MTENPTSTSYSGRLSDGKSAASADVTVRFGVTGLEIARPESSPETWLYANLSTAEPLTRHAIDALLSSTDNPGAVLFVPDAAFARELPAYAQHVTAGSARWRSARAWIASTAFLVAGAVALFLSDVSPARIIASAIPDKTRVTMGENVIKQMVGTKRLCEKPEGRAALAKLIARLTDGDSGEQFKVTVADWRMTNAFAAPGEQIVIARGIIDEAESPDEVAGVLAHEMGHGLERHPEAGLVRAIGLAAGAELVLGGSSGGLAGMGVLLAQLSYTRVAEREADLRALTLLRNAKVSPKGLASFFDRISKQEGETEDSGPLSVFRSHPLTIERRKLVESQPPYPTTPSLSTNEWQALRSICEDPAKPDTP